MGGGGGGGRGTIYCVCSLTVSNVGTARLISLSTYFKYWVITRQSLLPLHMTKSYVRTATRTTLKVEANLTQILNFKSNFHTEFEPFFKKKNMLTMVDTC